MALRVRHDISTGCAHEAKQVGQEGSSPFPFYVSSICTWMLHSELSHLWELHIVQHLVSWPARESQVAPKEDGTWSPQQPLLLATLLACWKKAAALFCELSTGGRIWLFSAQNRFGLI